MQENIYNDHIVYIIILPLQYRLKIGFFRKLHVEVNVNNHVNRCYKAY
jgi:hypothetical protein